MKVFKIFLFVCFGVPLLLVMIFSLSKNYLDPSQKAIADMNQVFAENKTQWEKQVANTPRDGTLPKFIVLKPYWQPEAWGTEFWAFVYDESDEIAIRAGLHLPFWKWRLSSATHVNMGHVIARPFGEHFYWIIESGVDNGYAMERHGDDYQIVQWNCSTFVEPITSSCPDQWLEAPSGELEPVSVYIKRHS